MIHICKKLLLILCILILPCAAIAKDKPTQKKAIQTEIRADRAFIRGDYDRAMRLYARTSEKYGTDNQRGLDLNLKMARLYILLQSPSEAIPCYDVVRQGADTMLTVDDVCFYIDALRQMGRDQQAEIVARQYAFLSPYRRNQRYLNTLYSLSNIQRYYGKGDSDYSVKLFKNSSSRPEYWLGKWDGDVFFAVSNSRIHDPLKIYYHQTQYYQARDVKNPVPFKSIPRELQSGPVAFSEDNRIMVATGISYRSSDRIEDITGINGMFVTQLYYSVIDSKRDSWQTFEKLFEHQEGSSYAHPAFFNDGQSIVFSSDRPGGYGGMDLYIAHWDEAVQKWSAPANMGSAVNTEGDEIFPRIVDGGLYFASNGLEGYGGYDIFKVSFRQNMVLPGSRYHYPHPINSVSNDFGIFFDGTMGYFISDRRGFQGKDDIYTFEANLSPLNHRSAVGVSEEYSAMTGNLNMLAGLKSSNTRTVTKEMKITSAYPAVQEGQLLLSLYFEFNESKLDAESMSALRSLLENPAFKDATELSILGYADELGTKQYNLNLSSKRAEAVARAMQRISRDLPVLHIEGRGQLTLTPEEYAEELQTMNAGRYTTGDYKVENYVPKNSLMFEDLVKLNHKLRRVDIVVKKNN